MSIVQSTPDSVRKAAAAALARIFPEKIGAAVKDSPYVLNCVTCGGPASTLEGQSKGAGVTDTLKYPADVAGGSEQVLDGDVTLSRITLNGPAGGLPTSWEMAEKSGLWRLDLGRPAIPCRVAESSGSDLNLLAIKTARLDQLRLAKAESDRRNYKAKHALMRKLLTAFPEEFALDSDDGRGIVGVTHSPTRFRMHLPRGVIPTAML